MTKSLRRLVGVAATVALLLSVAVAANASPPDQSGVIPQSGVVNRDQLPTRVQSLLGDVDVEATTFNIQRSGGATSLIGSDGWVIDLPDSEGPTPVNFAAGVGAGNFFAIRRVANFLEWGGENRCVAAPPGGVNPHRISPTLRVGVGPFDIGRQSLFRDFRRNSPFSLLANLAAASGCLTDGERVYDQVVNVTVSGTNFGPFVSPDSTVGCDLAP